MRQKIIFLGAKKVLRNEGSETLQKLIQEDNLSERWRINGLVQKSLQVAEVLKEGWAKIRPLLGWTN